ncbi:MAG: hypothetical protein P4L84_00825 [Isosphaeraceae bacterium]|nr:hypothetical protein [Isosphaeraceae bacterium]
MPDGRRDVPDGLTPGAKRARKEFLAVYGRYIEEPRAQVSLNVLVWGPSPTSASAAAKKRIQVRDTLVTLGHHAAFSEDLPSPSGRMSEKTKEYAQARAANLIVIFIEGAPGATAELHDFSSDLEIYHKIMVLVPVEYRKGYSARGAIQELEDATSGGGVLWYREGDLEKCRVLTAVVKRAEALRIFKFRQTRHANL